MLLPGVQLTGYQGGAGRSRRLAGGRGSSSRVSSRGGCSKLWPHLRRHKVLGAADPSRAEGASGKGRHYVLLMTFLARVASMHVWPLHACVVFPSLALVNCYILSFFMPGAPGRL